MADMLTEMRQAASRAGRAADYATDAAGGWIETLARLGYAAKGAVYTIVGILAVQAAFGSGSTEGSRGAIQTIADQPFGQILLLLTAIGLAGYVAWRLVQGIKDPEHKGTDAEGIVKRAGYVISGLVYASLAFLAVRTALGSGGGSGSDTRQTWTAELLSQPFGQWLVGLVGGVIIGVGLYQFYNAYKTSFMKKYKLGEMSASERTWARRLGRFGLSARGVTFLIIGGFFIQAAIQSDPSEARGLSAALDTLAQQPYGPWLLGVVALGFVAYGIYCFSLARYRRLQVH